MGTRIKFSTEMVEWFRQNGRDGAKKAAAVMTPEQKRARALKANAASQESKRRKKAAQQEGE